MDQNITLDLTQKAYGQNVKLWNSPQKVQDLLQVSNLAKDKVTKFEILQDAHTSPTVKVSYLV